ncbi:MAG: DUF4142 domain-containing protein [Saprospiraceae bacterium]
MKNKIQHLKSNILELLIVSALAISLLTALSACKNAKPEDTKKVAEEHNDAKFDNAKEDDAKFLVSAAEINLEEIQLGQLAQNKSMNSDVKSLGKMMETEHSKALSDLQVLAAKKQITIPITLTDDGMSASQKLMDLQGSKFDKGYCDMMVSGHKDAVNKFEKASTDATDPDIRNWAASMLPALRTHLDHSMTCQKKCENM